MTSVQSDECAECLPIRAVLPLLVGQAPARPLVMILSSTVHMVVVAAVRRTLPPPPPVPASHTCTRLAHVHGLRRSRDVMVSKPSRTAAPTALYHRPCLVLSLSLNPNPYPNLNPHQAEASC